jgi:hypothetical protein
MPEVLEQQDQRGADQGPASQDEPDESAISRISPLNLGHGVSIGLTRAMAIIVAPTRRSPRNSSVRHAAPDPPAGAPGAHDPAGYPAASARGCPVLTHRAGYSDFRGAGSASRGRSGAPPGLAASIVSSLDSFPDASVILTCSLTLALSPKWRHAAAVMVPDVVPEIPMPVEGIGSVKVRNRAEARPDSGPTHCGTVPFFCAGRRRRRPTVREWPQFGWRTIAPSGTGQMARTVPARRRLQDQRVTIPIGRWRGDDSAGGWGKARRSGAGVGGRTVCVYRSSGAPCERPNP